ITIAAAAGEDNLNNQTTKRPGPFSALIEVPEANKPEKLDVSEAGHLEPAAPETERKERPYDEQVDETCDEVRAYLKADPRSENRQVRDKFTQTWDNMGQ